jgi:hypothetical protein
MHAHASIDSSNTELRLREGRFSSSDGSSPPSHLACRGLQTAWPRRFILAGEACRRGMQHKFSTDE